MKYLRAALVTLALATAIHLDWHAARPVAHHLSLGWRWHWILAIPVFVLVAWYVTRAWPRRLFLASLSIVGVAALLGGVVEPWYEYAVDGGSFEWAFGRPRLAAFAAFVSTGVATYLLALAALRRRPRLPIPRGFA